MTITKLFRKDVRLPVQLQRAMAAEAEADREARAKIIAAEGEIKASRALREASLIMVDNPMALQVSLKIDFKKILNRILRIVRIRNSYTGRVFTVEYTSVQ